MGNNLTDKFVDNIISISTNKIPERLYAHVRCHFLDYLGVTLAGYAMQNEKVQKLLDSMPTGNCRIIGCDSKTDFFSAAFINGINSHFIELDDGHRLGMLHLEAPIFSALLSLYEKDKISVEDFFKGAVVGYEVAIRLAMSIQPSHKLKGYHASGTCGTVGVAAAIAAALHYDAVKMKNTLSAAMTSAAGLLEMIEDDSELKPYNVGRAVVDGLIAAYSGNAGFNAPKDTLGGKRGFLAVTSDKPNTDILLSFEPNSYKIEGSYMKPYAACRHLHPAIEGALTIAKTDGFDWRKVASVTVDAYHLAVFGHDHQVVSSVNSAKMSIPFSVAVALVKKSANMEDFATETVSDNDILNLAKKVYVNDSEELTKLCPSKRVSVVTITMDDGTIIKQRVDFPKGEPENPLTQQELEEKFRSLAIFGRLTKEECDEVIEEIWKEDLEICKIMNIICK